MAQHEFTPQPELGNPDGSLNFVNHKLQILNDGPRGMGVITGSYINKGETLVVYGGGFVDSAHISAIPSAIRPFYFQVATNIWYGHGLDKIGLGIAERINHSCSPNAGFRGIADIIAIRDIQRGESITIDYATLQSDELDGSCFDCACGATNCRKMVTINDWQQVTPNDPDYTLLQPFLQSRISKESSLNASVFSSLMFPSGWQSPVDNNILRSTLLSESLTIDHQHARAAKPIRKNEVVGLLGGQVISNKSIASLAPEIRFSYRAISDDHFIGPKNDSDAKITMVLRSGDAPNLEIKLNHFVVANRDIEAGEVLAVSSKGFWQGTDRPLLKSVGTAITGSLNKLDTESGHPPLKIVGSRCGRAEFATAQNHLSNLEKQSNQDTWMLAIQTTHVTTESIFAKYFKAACSFIKGAIVEDWMAAPIAFAGSISGTYITALCVAGLAPYLANMFGSATSAGYILTTSTMAVVLGYATYCLFYYGGMLLKEREGMLDEDEKFSKELFVEKWRIVKWDFLMHLPSDGYWVLGMFTVQGGLYATGTTSLFWSILFSQAISDVYYSLREPFYWRGAKAAARWSANRKSIKASRKQ